MGIDISCSVMYGFFSFREHDKGPEEFCQTLLRLMEANKHFKVSFLGSHTSDIPGPPNIIVEPLKSDSVK